MKEHCTYGNLGGLIGLTGLGASKSSSLEDCHLPQGTLYKTDSGGQVPLRC